MFKIALLGLLLMACTVTESQNTTNYQDHQPLDHTPPPTVAESQNWTTYQDPAGFAIDIPKGWKVRADAGRITVAGTNMERVTILPLQFERQLNANRAQGILVNLSNQFSSRQKWDMPKSGWQFGSNGVRAVGADDRSLRETTALWWANTPQGATVFFYGVAGQPARFQSLEPVFARILGSFSVTQSGGGRGNRADASDPLAGLRFARWIDPTERAFSVEVPADWRVSGGIRRLSPTRRVDEIVAQSPDAQMTVRSGDVNVPTQYVEPNQTLMSLGYREGQMISGGFLMTRFMPGVVFATNYVQMTAGRSCGNLQFLRQTDLADYVRNLASQGLLLERNHYTAGEVIYTCQYNNQTYVGYVFAETSLNPNPGVGNVWSLQRLYGFTAPANRATQADAVLQRIQSTTSINPQWWAAEVGGDARIAENFRRYREFSANLQQQTQAERWASWDRTTEQRGDLLQNVTRVVDPQTGEPYKVQGGSNYYWIDPTREVIVGTNTPYKPTWDFREMVQTYR